MEAAVASRYDMAGLRVVVSAGGTREPIDPVRFISNYSSGKMGFAVAAAAAARGAGVTLVTTANHPRHAGIEIVEVETAVEMLAALREACRGADLLVMAAAVADYRPARHVSTKIQREDADHLTLELEKNVDVLAELGREQAAEGVFRVGFAAETGDPRARAREKLDRKGLDAIVANDVSARETGFGSDYNEGILILRGGEEVALARASKREMADRILDAVAPRLRSRRPTLQIAAH
jgi:phosphopantothenoylcysteine decarboxylase/phosphopantothenate--cysteine ligase